MRKPDTFSTLDDFLLAARELENSPNIICDHGSFTYARMEWAKKVKFYDERKAGKVRFLPPRFCGICGQCFLPLKPESGRFLNDY